MSSDLLLYVDGLGLVAGLWPFAWIRFLPESSAFAKSPAAISIIIPARNEERNLPGLLISLKTQSGPELEMLVVDDDSQDATASAAIRGGARVIASRPLPGGWVGKTWACHQGALQARGDVLFFLDADTVLEPGGLQKIADAAASRGGALSIYPYHRVRRWHEELSAFFNCCVITAGRGKMLVGPALIIGREQYFSVGRHARVRDKILENHHLSEIVRGSGITATCFGGKGTLSFRMYPDGLLELLQGWGKAFAGGGQRRLSAACCSLPCGCSPALTRLAGL